MDSPKEKSGRKLGISIVALVFVLTAFAGVYYFAISQPEEKETPPNLRISSSTFQGMLTRDMSALCSRHPNLYEYSAADVDEYEAPEDTPLSEKNELKDDLHMYHSHADRTVKEIIEKLIVPVKGNKIFLAYYDNEDEEFYVFPEGIVSDEFSIEDPEDFEIPANEGFVIMSCKESDIWKVEGEGKEGNDLPEELDTIEEDWILIAAPEGDTLRNALADFRDKIKAVWVQAGPGFDFPKSATLAEAELDEDFNMVWLHIGEVDADEDEDAVAVALATLAEAREAVAGAIDEARTALTADETPEETMASIEDALTTAKEAFEAAKNALEFEAESASGETETAMEAAVAALDSLIDMLETTLEAETPEAYLAKFAEIEDELEGIFTALEGARDAFELLAEEGKFPLAKKAFDLASNAALLKGMANGIANSAVEPAVEPAAEPAPEGAESIPGVVNNPRMQPGNAVLTLTWEAPGNANTVDIAEYKILFGKDREMGITDTLTVQGDELQLVINNFENKALKNGTTYYAQIQAVSSTGQEGDYTATIFATPQGAEAVTPNPEAVRNFEVIPGVETLTLTWEEPANADDANIQRYVIVVADNRDFIPVRGGVSISRGELQWVLTNAATDRPFWFKIQAFGMDANDEPTEGIFTEPISGTATPARTIIAE